MAANAADLDFIPGLLIGNINQFHQGASHSLLAAVLFGGIVTLMMRPFCAMAVRIGMVSVGLYASHLFLDFFSRDIRAPFGQPLLWPFSSEHFISPWSIFGGVQHGVPGDDVSTFLAQLFSWHNLGVLGLEVLLLLPILLLVWIRFKSDEAILARATEDMTAGRLGTMEGEE